MERLLYPSKKPVSNCYLIMNSSFNVILLLSYDVFNIILELIKMYLIVLRPLFSEKMVENVEMKQSIVNKLTF